MRSSDGWSWGGAGEEQERTLACGVCGLQPLLEPSAWASAVQRLHCPTFACRYRNGPGVATNDSSWVGDLEVDTRMQAGEGSRTRPGIGEIAGFGKGELLTAGLVPTC